MEYRKFFLALAAVCLAGGGASAACTMALVSALPLQSSSGTLRVAVSINGKPMTMIFDTGAFTSLLTRKAADRADMRILTSEEFDAIQSRFEGIGGGSNAIGMVARTVDFGGLKARNYNFFVEDVVEDGSDGLISIDLISQYDVDLDLPEQKALLYRPIGDCSAPAAFLSGPLYRVGLLANGEDRRPRILVQVGGIELTAMVDTGAQRSAIFAGAAAKLGLTAEVLAKDRVIDVTGVGPARVRAAVHRVGPVDIGELSIDSLPVRVLQARQFDDVQMLLGADFLSAVHVWISYSSKSLIMQFPPSASKKIGG